MMPIPKEKQGNDKIKPPLFHYYQQFVYTIHVDCMIFLGFVISSVLHVLLLIKTDNRTEGVQFLNKGTETKP